MANYMLMTLASGKRVPPISICKKPKFVVILSKFFFAGLCLLLILVIFLIESLCHDLESRSSDLTGLDFFCYQKIL